MPKLNYVIGVSWPRSGHHLLERLLTGYFGTEFGYCEHYEPGDCCRVVPCSRAGDISFSKNHDYNSAVPILNDQNYIVQYRKFIPSAVSNYELFVRNGNEDTAAEFEKFCERELRKYVRFLNRWSAARQRGGVIARVSYETICRSPKEVLSAVIPLFQPRTTLDEARIGAAIATVDYITVEDGEERPAEERGVRERRNIEAFRHFKEPLFRKLDEASREPYERMATLPLIRHGTGLKGVLVKWVFM